MVLGRKWHGVPTIVAGALCNGIACYAYGTITRVEVLALLGRARGFMAKVGYVHSQVGETPSPLSPRVAFFDNVTV